MFKKSDVKDMYNLTPMQAGILFHYMMDEKSFAYFEQLIFSASGYIDVTSFEKAFNKVIEKYDVLRTVFLHKKVKRPLQVVLKQNKGTVDFSDISHLPEAEKKSFVQKLAQQDKEKGFNLEKDILMRVAVIKTAVSNYTIIWSHHHIIMDGWCMGIIIDDFIRFYYQFKEGKDIKIEPAPPYSRYLQWLERQDKNKGLRFWKTYLEGYEHKAVLPGLKTAPEAGQTKYKLEEYHMLIDETTSSALKRIAKENEVTLNTLFQVTWGLLLQQYNNNNDVVIGTVVSGRPGEIEDIERIIGLFINTVPVRIKTPARQSLANFFKTFQEQETAAKRYEYLPLADIQAQTLLQRDLLNHILVFENYPVQEKIEQTTSQGQGKVDFRIEADLEYHEQSNYDFNIVISPGNQINLRYSFNSLVYEPGDVSRIASHFKQVIAQVIENPYQQIKDIEILTPGEKQQILYEFNQRKPEPIQNKTIHALFEEQAQKTPGNTATASPLDLQGIYNRLETGMPALPDPEMFDDCCFRENPYICQHELELSSSGHNHGQFYILKTHRHNSVIVNDNLRRLLKLFNGSSNLISIYNQIKEKEQGKDHPPVFFIYSMSNIDLLEITFQFNQQPGVFTVNGKEDFVRLVQGLARDHLIELTGMSPWKPGMPDTVIEGFNNDRNPAKVKAFVFESMQLKSKEKKWENVQVLLLGDTPGISTTGLLYLGSYLHRNGIKTYCQFYEPSQDYASMKKNLRELLEKVRPKIVAISMKWFLYISRVLDMCDIVKEYSRANSLDIKIVVGGNTASYYWQDIIKYETIDYLIRGDGEEPLLDLCQQKDITRIPNCVYKQDGKIMQNPMTYVQDESHSPGIYLSHLDEILYEDFALPFGTFFIYTHKGCGMNCIYCGGGRHAQERTFNRKHVFKRGIPETRKDIIAAKPYTSTFQLEFDIPDKNLAGYCRQIWEGIDLTHHFCLFSTLTPPTGELIELVSKTFKYVYWDFDICTPSERHRQQLFSRGLVKPQPTDKDILDFMARCEKYSNIEVRLNLITGLPYFTPQDIEQGRQLLTTIMKTYSCFGELHWARLHAQPGAPILENAEIHHMHSYASGYQEFLTCSQENFNRTSGYSTVENFNYPYIYYKENSLNSQVTNFYLEINKKVAQHHTDRQRSVIATKTITYRELDEKADQLAGILKAKGIKPANIIGLMLERTLDIPIGILGILKAGCAYMPIDPEFPLERIKYMLKDTNAKALVTTNRLAEEAEKLRSWQGETILLDLLEPGYCPGRGEVSSPETIPAADSQRPANATTSFPTSTLTSTSTSQVTPANLAYVIYTSGTTGIPKGVPLSHENLVNYVHWFSTAANLSPKDKTILTSSFAFDLGYTSLYPSLLQGGELHILPREIYLLGERLLEYIRQKGITYIKVTPSLFSVIINSPNFSAITCKSLRMAVIGGEAINVNDIETAHSVCPHLDIMNHYGPTEATIGSVATFVDFHRFQEYKSTPVIGKPVYNTRVYILGKELNLLPVGIPGELCISGTCLSRGYLNRPELTAEKFIKSHRSDRSDRLYHTGDLARWLPDGTINFLGRIDTQVKVRGYRIELGEIENCLRKHHQVEDALVVVKEQTGENADGENENRDKYLCAYIVPKGEKIIFPTNSKRSSEIENIHQTLTLATRFLEQVKKNPARVAVKSQSKSLTYDSLDKYANLLARKILQEYDDRYKLLKDERLRYKRQMLLHGWGPTFQEKLKSTTVFVAGAGGGASPTITQLALIGFGTIKVCDYDEVEMSNLNRQFLHDESRIGMNKVLSAQMTVARMNPHVNVIPYTQKLTTENIADLVGDAAIIFDMFDGLADKFILSRYAVENNIPHLILAMTDINAYATVLHPPYTPCYHCLFDKGKLGTIISGMQHYMENYSKNPLPVVSTSLFISSGIIVNEALKILMEFETPAYSKFFYFNQRGASSGLAYTPGYKAMTHLFSDHFLRTCKQQGFDWEVGWRGNFLEELTIEPDPDCPICGKGREKHDTQGEHMKKMEKTAIPIHINDNPGEKNKRNEQKQTVASLLSHDINLAVGIVGVMNAGKTHVPLDPASSTNRWGIVLEDSESRVILTDNHYLEAAKKLRNKINKNIKIINLDEINKDEGVENNLEIDLVPGQTACMLYPPDSSANPTFNQSMKELYGILLNGSGTYAFEDNEEKTEKTGTDTLSLLTTELRNHLLDQLPDYMIPSHFVRLDKLPLTPNGKVDFKALPEPTRPNGKEKEIIPPRNEVEEKLAEIWADVLEIEKDSIGIDTNFFESGGHSLNAAIMVARVHKELDLNLSLAEVFELPTIQGIASLISVIQWTGAQETGVNQEKEVIRL